MNRLLLVFLLMLVAVPLLAGWSTAGSAYCGVVECSTETELPDCEITVEEDAVICARAHGARVAPSTSLTAAPRPARITSSAPPSVPAASLSPVVPLRC